MKSRRTEHIGPPCDHPERPEQYTDAALCGADGVSSSRVSRAQYPDGWRTCPACSAKYYGAKLAAEFPTVTLHKASNPDDEDRSYKTYRGVHEVRVGGVVRGYVCSQQGWGKGYTVHCAYNSDQDGSVRIQTYANELPTGRVVNSNPNRDGCDKFGNRALVAKDFGSKEHAAYAMCVRILTRALTGWREFPPPMEPAAYLAKRARDREQEAQRKEQRRQETIASMGDRVAELDAERERALERDAVLRALNVETDAAVEAIAYARELIAKDVKRIEGAMESARTHRQRAEQGVDL